MIPRWKNGPMKCDHAGPFGHVGAGGHEQPDAEDVEPVDLAVRLAQPLVVVDRVVAQLEQVRETEHRATCLLQSGGGRNGHRSHPPQTLEW
jgi:hypothetical protein